MKNLAVFLICCMLAFGATVSRAVEFHGALSSHHSVRWDTPYDPGLTGGDFIWAEERAQLKVSGGSGPTAFFGKIDFNHDQLSGRSGVEIREAYLNYAAGPLDLRLGRQVVTWGIGDMVFINDVFPKDYNAFFSGRSVEYLKGAISGVKAGLYSRFASVDAVVTPVFEPNRMPDPSRYSYFDPFAGIADRASEPPRSDMKNAELALRISKPLLYWDLAIYGYRGYSRTPTVRLDSPTAPTRLAYVYPELNSIGVSAQGPALGGVLGIESGYHDSPWDREGTDPLVPNSEYRYLVGYQFSPWADFQAGIQYYGEIMADHAAYLATLPPGFPAKDGLRQLLVLRLTRFMAYQSLKLSLVAFYSPTDQDYYLVPEASYKISDEMAVACGGNLFGGSQDRTDFAQMDANDNLYLGVRYEF